MFSPKKSLKSRYSLTIPQGNYSTYSIYNDDTILVGHKSNSIAEQGLIFTPYIVAQTTTILMDRDTSLMGNLKEKVKRLQRNNKINDILNG